MIFPDRIAAGRLLGLRLGQLAIRGPILVLALPRGGVPIGFEVARALHAPLDLFLVRKLGAPGHQELAIGAIASDGVRMLEAESIRILGIPPSHVEAITQKQARAIERLEQLYRGNRDAPDVHGRTLILVDDGMATGSTMRVAVIALRRKDPREIIAAVPVASVDACDKVEKEADAVVCLYRPQEFFAVGQWYRDFSQVGDAEVRDLLDKAKQPAGQVHQAGQI
jgi:predicted phosphoribosyltransferase